MLKKNKLVDLFLGTAHGMARTGLCRGPCWAQLKKGRHGPPNWWTCLAGPTDLRALMD